MSSVIEHPVKQVVRRMYGLALALRAMLAGDPGGSGLKVWYGGARAAKLGGPALKLGKLAERFPEDRSRFTLAYLLSNMPYLPESALSALKRRGVPIVLNQNGVFYPAWYGGDWQGRNRAMAAAYHAADHVLWQSDFCRRAADRFLGERAGPGEVLANAVDIDRFRPQPVRPVGRFRFLLTGRIDAHQSYRLEQAVRGLAAARAQGLEAELLVAGVFDPSAKAKAMAAAGELKIGGAVRFRGAYGPEDAPALVRDAEAYVTLTHQDACPTGVIEALACGLPVVHVGTGGVPELVGDAGAAVPSAEDWETQRIPEAAAVGAAMLAVAERRAEMSALARARAEERFSLAKWLDHHEALFKRLLEGR
ncbi:MAG: glycosyltransferase family 4 protein [Actinomycetota bacterium]